MCGINGIFAYRGGTAEPDEIRLTRDFMAARGPDGSGEWFSPDRQVGLGHRRLSIIDLSSGGAQPMRGQDDDIVVTFNGEIYNFLILRQDLESRGCRFHSRSDTEVLIHLYRLYGAAMVKLLRGMFAFGLWDAKHKTLLLARDPYGIKPLYYADDGRSLRFASSVKALIAGGRVASAPCAAGIAGFYLFGSVPEPWTSAKAIKAVPAGALLQIDRDGARRESRYCSLAEAYRAAETEADREAPDPVATAAAFRAGVLDSVRHHLIADVPVGAFLSAGVDSGALLGLMRDAGQGDICTVTLAFDAFAGSHDDESPLAVQVAHHYGARHVTRRVGAQEFDDDMPKIIAAMDQPSIDGVNTWFVSKATRELGLKVAISGVGGDELVGGYSTFGRLPKLVRALRFLPKWPGAEPLAGAAVAAAHRLGLRVHPKSAGLLAFGQTFAGAYLLQRSVYLPSELRQALADPGFAAAGLGELQPLAMLAGALDPKPRRNFSTVAILESAFYLRNQLLRDTDWAGMAHSVEIRTPLVDSHLLARVAPLFARPKPPNGKVLLAGAPSQPLPRESLERRKTGFGVPLRQWSGDRTAGVGTASAPPSDPRLWSRAWLNHVMRERRV